MVLTFVRGWAPRFRSKAVAVLIAASVPALAACIVFPTPTHGVGMVSKDTIASISPGQTTRADVLMRLGDPSQSYQYDRFFVYEWQESHGVWVAVFPGGPGGDVTTAYLLVVEFAADGTVRRSTALSRVFGPDKVWDDARKWMEMTDKEQ